jgi:hypothetical protein
MSIYRLLDPLRVIMLIIILASTIYIEATLYYFEYVSL